MLTAVSRETGTLVATISSIMIKHKARIRPAQVPSHILAYCPDLVGCSATGPDRASALARLTQRMAELLGGEVEVVPDTEELAT